MPAPLVDEGAAVSADSLYVEDLVGVEGGELEAAVVKTLGDEDLVVSAGLGVDDQVGAVVVSFARDVQDVVVVEGVADVVLVVGVVFLLKSPLVQFVVPTSIGLDDS